MPAGGCDTSENHSVRRFGGDDSKLSAGFSFDVTPWYDTGSDCDVTTSARRRSASAGRVQSGRHARSTAAQNILKCRLLRAVLMRLACRRRDRATDPPGRRSSRTTIGTYRFRKGASDLRRIAVAPLSRAIAPVRCRVCGSPSKDRASRVARSGPDQSGEIRSSTRQDVALPASELSP
jgi:hypothetical protein